MKRRFVSLWIILTLVLVGLAVLALWFSPASAQADPGADRAAIEALVGEMEEAVLNQDRTAYLERVDLSDPVFASEHTYWVDDWAEAAPLDRFSLNVANIQPDSDAATADLTMRWALLPDTSYREAIFPVQFVRGEDGAWRYAGEAWVAVEADHFLVQAFPGMEEAAEQLITALPDIYAHATSSLGHWPDAVVEIKLYDTSDALGGTIALSLPPIRGWNEPGESLKMLVLDGELPSAAVLAHELTHFLNFDMADTSHGSYPWWLLEGVAQYVSAQYRDEEWASAQLAGVQELYIEGELAPWELMSNFEETPTYLWRFVYPQGYVFTRFVTETYSPAQRNAWLWALAGNETLNAATESAFGVTFAELDEAFGVWLVSQPLDAPDDGPA